jgi:hypothetical protein
MLQHDQELSQHLKFGRGAKLKFRGKILNLFLGFFFFFGKAPKTLGSSAPRHYSNPTHNIIVNNFLMTHEPNIKPIQK